MNGFIPTKIVKFNIADLTTAKKGRVALAAIFLFLFMLPLFFGVNPSVATTEALNLPKDTAGENIAPYLSVLVDPKGDMTIEEVATSKNFIKNTDQYPNFGFSQETYWVKFTLANRQLASGQWFLEFAYPLIDQLSLFQLPTSQGTRRQPIEAYHTGDSFPFTERKVQNRHFIFPVNLNAGESKELYFRIQSRDTLEIPILIWSAEQFYRSDHDTQTFIGSYFGIMAAMIVYNLIVYFLVREKLYFYYTFVILCFSMFIMTLTGYAFEYLWPESPLIAKNSRPFFIGASIVFIGFFVKELFRTSEKTPKSDRALTVLMVLGGLTSLLALAGLFKISIVLAVLVSLPFSALLLLIAFLRLQQGYTPAKTFLLGWGFFLVGVIVYGVKAVGLIEPIFIVRHGMMLGSVIQVVALASALAERLNLIRGQLKESNTQLVSSRKQIINRLSIAGEFRDNETGMHVVRVSRYAKALGLVAGLSEGDAETLYTAAPLHDIGKIGIVDAVLLKPGKLTPQERTHMELHAEIGGKIIGTTESKLMSVAKEIALTHHEYWDGNGYPSGIKGEEIPKVGRIVAICDVFDALTSARPYKEAWSVEKAVDLIQSLTAVQFDPELVRQFMEILPQILEIKEKYADQGSDSLESAAKLFIQGPE